MITTWPTHEERFPKMPCGRRKLNASCKRTRYSAGKGTGQGGGYHGHYPPGPPPGANVVGK